MDSGSGSLQSSSGGDDEYDSRAAVAFMNSARVSDQQLFEEYINQSKNPSMMIGGAPPPPAPPTPPVFSVSGAPPSLIPAEEPTASTAARNSKKRSRASRRAPTTVLTTDTSNFRAMVQEFTGIPSLSFTNSPFTRRRLDLFGSSLRSSDTTSPTPPPQYLRFPFAEKMQFHPPPPARNSFVSPSTDPSSFYTSNLNSQSNPRFPFSVSPILGTKSDLVFTQQPKMGFSEEPHNLIFTDQLQLQKGGDKDTAFNGGYGLSLRDTSDSGLVGTSTSNYPGGKPPENAAANGRESAAAYGASWICSSQWR